MKEHFPIVGIIGDSPLSAMMIGPSMALGMELSMLSLEADMPQMARCSLVTFFANAVSLSKVKTLERMGVTVRPSSKMLEFIEHWNASQVKSEGRFSVLVARSPHGQAAVWTPTQIEHGDHSELSITPAEDFSEAQLAQAQVIALEIARAGQFVGIVDVEILLHEGELRAGRIWQGPSNNGRWTIEGARTSQFEQHLRAILDLPLGDPSSTSTFAVSGSFFGRANMYRPYLHLMARSPGLKFHQYLLEGARGHVTALGDDLLDLKECVAHAVEYMSGEIDE